MSQQASRAFQAIRSEAANNALAENPDLSSRTIARMLHLQYPELFPTVEKARDMIRYRRGIVGEKNRKTLKDKRYVRQSL